MRATWITVAVLLVLVVAFGAYMLSVNPLDSMSTQGHKLPKVVVKQTVFDFGVMGQKEKGEHEFEIANQGEGPLELRRGAVSCKCVATLVDKVVPPGGTGKFTLQWTTLTLPDPTFIHTAVVMTNDPQVEEIHFRIQGRIRPAFIVEPLSLDFGDVEHGTASKRSAFDVWSPDKDFKITRWERTEHITVKVAPMPADRVKKLKAESGYGVTVQLEPAFPTGRLDKRNILFHTNHKTRKTFAMSLRGYVVGQLSFEPRRAAFKYVNSAEGKAVKVYVFFRGKEKVSFAVARVKPSFLEVGVKSAEGATSRYVITIHVPTGAPAGPFEGTVSIQSEYK